MRLTLRASTSQFRQAGGEALNAAASCEAPAVEKQAASSIGLAFPLAKIPPS